MLRTRIVFLALLAGACGGSSDDPPDAGMPEVPDAAPPDAGDPDPDGPCPEQLVFTGDYVDWDSTDEAFAGVPFAAVGVVGSDDSVETAPNGRSVLCVDDGAPVDVEFLQRDYLDVVFSALPSDRVYSLRGLARVDVDAVFVGPLPAYDADAAQVVVRAETEDGQPLAAPTVGGASAVFSRDGAGPLVEGDIGTGWYLYPNVPVGDGTAALTVEGDCDARDSITLRADAIAYTRIICSAP